MIDIYLDNKILDQQDINQYFLECSREKSKYDKKLSFYYKLIEAYDDYKYNNAVVLHGVRRTGKSVALDQFKDYLIENKVNFWHIILIKDGLDLTDFTKYVLVNKNINTIIIDEFTRFSNFKDEINILLDACANYNIKLILTGTESYLISLSSDNSAFGRYTFISTSQLIYHDILKIVDEKDFTFFDYSTSNNVVGSETLLKSLISSLYLSIDKGTKMRKNPLVDLDITEIEDIVSAIIESIIYIKSERFKIPKKKLEYIEFFDSFINKNYSDRSITKEEFYTVLLELVRLNLFYTLDVYNPTKENITSISYYLSSPNLLIDLIESHGYTGLLDCNLVNKNGDMIESCVIANILYYIKNNKSYNYFTIRNHNGSLEVDLCIHNVITDTINLIEIKKNSKLSAGNLFNKDLNAFKNKYKQVNYYKIYCIGNLLEDKNSSVKDIKVEDFLKDMMDKRELLK